MDSVAHHALDSVTIGVYSSDEVKSLSVIKCTNPQSFDPLGHATKNGLCDKAMGKFLVYRIV